MLGGIPSSWSRLYRANLITHCKELASQMENGILLRLWLRSPLSDYPTFKRSMPELHDAKDEVINKIRALEITLRRKTENTTFYIILQLSKTYLICYLILTFYITNFIYLLIL